MSLSGVVSSRFAVAIHILIFLSWYDGIPTPSSRIAASVNTNPVVVRRLISALREAGMVTVQQGAEGGALLARSLEEIRLSEVYLAVEKSHLFSGHPQLPNAQCLIGRNVPSVLHEVFDTAEAAMLQALYEFTLGSVWKKLTQRVQDEATAGSDEAEAALASIHQVLGPRLREVCSAEEV